MVIKFRKRVFETSTEVIGMLADIEAKQVEILSIDKKMMRISLNGLSKKEIKNFIVAGFEVSEIAEGKNILIYESK